MEGYGHSIPFPGCGKGACGGHAASGGIDEGGRTGTGWKAFGGTALQRGSGNSAGGPLRRHEGKTGRGKSSLLQPLFEQARKLGSNNACAWYAQLISEAQPPQEQELRKAALDLLSLHDERGMPYLKEPLSFPQKNSTSFPPTPRRIRSLSWPLSLGTQIPAYSWASCGRRNWPIHWIP